MGRYSVLSYVRDFTELSFNAGVCFFTLHTKRFKFYELSRSAAPACPLTTISSCSVCPENSAGNLLITKKPDGCYNLVDPRGSSRLIEGLKEYSGRGGI
ncbi:hypothetical protein DPMN_110294 [Dreissena polymorpha]|uniref:Uncharacterized protein n=1 Tax=Dreissena polymorpha TaxID=45954 RepID=A0A9D4KBV2_DREPO|nr:hypothetical protein DPMN_110294 [Dreissena polymorpha]